MPGSELYEKFMALHIREGGLVLPNAWDAVSALILADAGFEAACSTEPGFNRLDSALFALRRLDVYGTDDLAGFRRKIRFGANRFTNGDLVRYYINHFLTRFHG